MLPGDLLSHSFQWVIPLWLISHQTHHSVQWDAGTVHNYSNSCSGLFWPQTLCIAFESRAFSRCLFHSNKSCSLLFVSLTCLHRISRCPKEKNNIKCIIFVVLEGLCVICLAPSTEQKAPPSLLVAGLLSVTAALQMETFVSARLIV